MTTHSPRDGSTGAAARSRELAEQFMPVEMGVDPDDARAPEQSPYERLFTGGNTVMPKPHPLRVNTANVILIGIGAWALALLVVVLVPELHAGSRTWWPWTCVAGMALGGLGWTYVRRGRGNAEAA